MYCCRRRNKRHSIENYREVSDVKDLPDFRAGVLYTSAIPRTWCARPRVRSEESLCRRGWGFGFGRAGTPPGFLKLSPSPVFLVWSRGGRKNVSLLIVTAQAFSSSSVKNRWNALNNKLPNFFFFFLIWALGKVHFGPFFPRREMQWKSLIWLVLGGHGECFMQLPLHVLGSRQELNSGAMTSEYGENVSSHVKEMLLAK